MLILFQLFLLLLLIIYFSSAAIFSPDKSDYNAYGLKVAANNLMIVEVKNDDTQFLIHFAPYTDNITQSSQQTCLIEYENDLQYVYTIALGKNQTTYDIFFVGEMLELDQQNPLSNRIFIGVLRYTGTFTTIDCDTGFTFITQFLPGTFAHQEHLIMVTDPFGLVAYGFSNLFTFSYTASTNILIVHQNNSLSPSTVFLPFAVDYDGNLGVIAGFLNNGRNSRIKYIPTIILFSVDTLTAIATAINSWNYSTSGTTWQAGLTNAGVDKYDAKFDMSVSMNPTITQILVGIQSMNTVFFFNYTTTSLIFISSVDHGQTIGFGKSVAWLSYSSNSYAILFNVYSIRYEWISSKIHIYDTTLRDTSIPISIFPNIQQSLYKYMSLVFLNIITTPNNLILLDNQGNLFVFLSAPSGYYTSTIGPSAEIVPAFSSQLPCIPGTYKNITGISRCYPCPTGTKNDGTNSTITTCVNCATNTFCPLGSTSDSISNDILTNVIQAFTYPSSPDITGLDDILFFTLFSIGSSARCVALSPLFWTLIIAAIAVIITIVMLLMKYCVKHPKAATNYNKLETILKQTDVIAGGQLWFGGLATFCIFVLVISCYIFSANYYSSYPIETAGPSTYTCDTNIRNAQFSSSLQSSSIPVSDEMQEMIDLLDNQPVNLNVAFLNTVYNCTSNGITLSYQLGTTWIPILTNVLCNSSNYILSYSALLPFKKITVQFYLPNIYTIGGLRIGLSGSGQVKSDTTKLQDLNFSEIFNQNGRMLGQDASISLQLTKVINDTHPLVTGNNDTFSGIWVVTFTVNYYKSFYSDTDYLNAPDETSTYVTLDISETPYFIYNEQGPIARLPILIFHNFLFTTMIIGSFAFVLVLFNLMILPFSLFIIHKCKSSFGRNNRIGNSSSRPAFADADLEKSTSNLNGPKYSEKDHHNVISFQQHTSSLNQDDNHNKVGSEQLPLPDVPVLICEDLPQLQITADDNRINKETVKE